MLRILHRRPMGWMALGVVASLFVGSAAFGLVAAVVSGQGVVAFWRCVELAFWFALASAALRRTHEPAEAAAP